MRIVNLAVATSLGERKPVTLCLKIDLVSHLVCEEELDKYKLNLKVFFASNDRVSSNVLFI